MSTSLLYHQYGLRGYDYVRTRYVGGEVHFHAAPKAELVVCPHCRSRKLKRRGRYERKLRLPSFGFKQVYLLIKVPRVECMDCGVVRLIELKVADSRRFYTRSFERQVLDCGRMMTIQNVARFLKIGWDTVKDIVKRNLARRFAKPKLGHLKRLAIDEISVAKGGYRIVQNAGKKENHSPKALNRNGMKPWTPCGTPRVGSSRLWFTVKVVVSGGW